MSYDPGEGARFFKYLFLRLEQQALWRRGELDQLAADLGKPRLLEVN